MEAGWAKSYSQRLKLAPRSRINFAGRIALQVFIPVNMFLAFGLRTSRLSAMFFCLCVCAGVYVCEHLQEYKSF